MIFPAFTRGFFIFSNQLNTINMNTKLPENIKTREEAEAFIISLMDNREDFHPEDSAFDVRNRDGYPFFTFEESSKLDELFEEAYDIDGFNAADFMWNELQKRNEQKTR